MTNPDQTMRERAERVADDVAYLAGGATAGAVWKYTFNKTLAALREQAAESAQAALGFPAMRPAVPEQRGE